MGRCITIYRSTRKKRDGKAEARGQIKDRVSIDKRFPQIEINGEAVWRNEKAHPNFHVQELISQEERVAMVLRRAGQYEVSVE